MKQTYKIAISVIILSITYSGLWAQAEKWEETKATKDSLQRIWMQQHLRVTDDMVTRIFLIRDSMYMEVNGIRSDRSLPAAEQDRLVNAARRIAEEGIHAILGEANFLLYKEAIRQRLQRSGRTDQPLAGAIN